MNKLIINYYLSKHLSELEPLLHEEGHIYSISELQDILSNCNLSANSNLTDLLIKKLYPDLQAKFTKTAEYILLKSYKEMDKEDIIDEISKLKYIQEDLSFHIIKQTFNVTAIKNRREMAKKFKQFLSGDDITDGIAMLYEKCTDFNFGPENIQKLNEDDIVNIYHNFKKFSQPLRYERKNWIDIYTKKYFSFYHYLTNRNVTKSEEIYNWTINNVENKKEYIDFCCQNIENINILNEIKKFMSVNLPNRIHDDKIDADFFEIILKNDIFNAIEISGMNFLYAINDLIDTETSSRKFILHYLGGTTKEYKNISDNFLFKLLSVKAVLKKKTANRITEILLLLSDDEKSFVNSIENIPDNSFKKVLQKIDWNTVKDEDLGEFIIYIYKEISILPITEKLDSKVALILVKNYNRTNKADILPYYTLFNGFYSSIKNAKQKYLEIKTRLFCECINYIYKYNLKEDSLKALLSTFLEMDENTASKKYPLAKNRDELFSCILANEAGLRVDNLNDLNKLIIFIKFEGDKYATLYSSMSIEEYVRCSGNIGMEIFNKMGIDNDFIEQHINEVAKFLKNGLFEICHKYICSYDVHEKQRNSLGNIVKAIFQNKYDEIRWNKERLEIELNKAIPDEEYRYWKNDTKKNYKDYTIQDCSDFYSIMTLGEYPVSTCQSYNNGSYNSCLLSNFDESKKVLKIFKQGKQIGRAILRLTLTKYNEEFTFNSQTESLNKFKPSLTIFVEKLYTNDMGESCKAMKYILDFLQDKATKVNANLMLADVYSDLIKDISYMLSNQTVQVMISATRNQVQYIDSLVGHARKETQYSWHKAKCYILKK